MNIYTYDQRQGRVYHPYVVPISIQRGACAVCGNRRSHPSHKKGMKV